MDEKLKALLIGLLRTIIVCILTGLLMYFLGHWDDHKSAVFVSALYLPFYFVYKIYFSKGKKQK